MKILKVLDRVNIDMIGSELVGVLVSRLNVIISSGLIDESVLSLDAMIRKSGLVSTSVSNLDDIINAAIR